MVESSNEIFRFVLHTLLRSEDDLKREKDEEVNLYLAQILLGLTDPLYQQWSAGYVKEHDSSVFQSAEEFPDRVHKYLLYKLNADYLLTSLGIFQNIGRPRGAYPRFYEQGPHIYMGRGKAYYGMAAEYNHQIYRHPTSVQEILQKLSRSFEDYVRILAYIRSTYFDFVRRISKQDLINFAQQLKLYEREQFPPPG